MCVCVYTHTHTHTYVYIYGSRYIWEDVGQTCRRLKIRLKKLEKEEEGVVQGETQRKGKEGVQAV